MEMNLAIRELVREEMNRRFPQEEMSFSNLTVATIIAKGLSEKLTTDWLRKHLLGCVEDEFITYGQAISIKDSYYKAICEVKKVTFGIG